MGTQSFGLGCSRSFGGGTLIAGPSTLGVSLGPQRAAVAAAVWAAGELLHFLSGHSRQLRDLPDWGKGEGGVLLNGELSGSLETKSDSKTKKRNKNQRKC